MTCSSYTTSEKMTNMKIIFVLMVTFLNSINSLPTLNIANNLPTTGLSQELINIIRNSRLNSLLPNPPTPFSSPFSKSNPPASSSTLNPFTNLPLYNQTPQLPTPILNPAELNGDYLGTPSVSNPASDSNLSLPKASNQQSNLDLLLNYNRNNQNSLLSGSPQKSVPNSFPDPTQLLQSLLRPSITDTLPTKTATAIASPSDLRASLIPNLLQSPSPKPKLLPIEPLNLSPKVNEEILKLLSGSTTTPLQEPNKNTYSNSIPTPDSALLTDITPSSIPPSSTNLASSDSAVSLLPPQPPPPPPPPSPLPPSPPPSPPPPSPSPDVLSATQLLNTLVSSPSVVKELTSLLESYSAQNSNSSPSLSADNQQPPADKSSLN